MHFLATTLLLQFIAAIALAANTQNYNILVAAAAKKKATVQVGKSYLLVEKQGFHHKIIVGTVTQNNGDLDFDATMTQLVKDNKAISGAEMSDYCSCVGNPCTTQPRDKYQCGVSNGQAVQKYKFAGTATEEFADPTAFKAKGDVLVQRMGGYNILWHNCQTFARGMANVASV